MWYKYIVEIGYNCIIYKHHKTPLFIHFLYSQTTINTFTYIYIDLFKVRLKRVEKN